MTYILCQAVCDNGKCSIEGLGRWYEVEERVILSRRSESRQCLSPDPPAEDRLTQSILNLHGNEAAFQVNENECAACSSLILCSTLECKETVALRNRNFSENKKYQRQGDKLTRESHKCEKEVGIIDANITQREKAGFLLRYAWFLNVFAEQQQQQWQQSSYNTVGRKDYMIFGVK
ncbi:hypothetical protein MG293_009921 [Ovis ammon polii]|uniref:Uncharacterized protein n=1 Tax=Ovis ammon polii TaxID=230172 RepID=A0AAD4U5C4_OVIAM|nr:hypothetical protein MG293_009921 [Ovis ammon polii]